MLSWKHVWLAYALLANRQKCHYCASHWQTLSFFLWVWMSTKPFLDCDRWCLLCLRCYCGYRWSLVFSDQQTATTHWQTGVPGEHMWPHISDSLLLSHFFICLFPHLHQDCVTLHRLLKLYKSLNYTCIKLRLYVKLSVCAIHLPSIHPYI